MIAAATADDRIVHPLTPILVAGAAISNVTDVRYEGRLWLSGSFLCCLLAAAVLSPSAGALVALSAEVIAWAWCRFALAPLAINCFGTVAPTWLAGLMLAALTPLVGTEGIDFDITLGLVACLDLAGNIAIVASLMALHEELPLLKHVGAYRRLLPFLAANVVLLVAVTEAYRRVGIAAASFLIVVMLVFTFVVRLFVDARERANEIEELSQSRGRLVAEAVNADERARRQLATELHDEALQSMLAARQELEDANRGDAEGVTRAEVAIREAVSRLRHAVLELHPVVLEHAGLEPAIRAVADEHARRSGFNVHLAIEHGVSGLNDHLLFSLLRELIANASKHAGAENVWIQVQRWHGVLKMEVRDDGKGFRDVDLTDLIRSGHIGLASSRERIEALGGTFLVNTSPGVGTEVRIAIPVSPLEQAGVDPHRRATPAGRDA